jgi:hypothetical protein
MLAREAEDVIEALRAWLQSHEELAFGLGIKGEQARLALERYDAAVEKLLGHSSKAENQAEARAVEDDQFRRHGDPED